MLNTLAYTSFNDVDTIRGAWPPPVLRALCNAVMPSERRSASRWHDDGSTKIRLCTASCPLPLSHVPEKVTGVVAQ